jgi:hypothetical protein
MKRDFQVGDRVVAYFASRHPGVSRHVGMITKIGIFKNPACEMQVQCNSESSFYTLFVHPKQCRRLIKKEKKKPREFWVNVYCDDGFGNDGVNIGGLHESREEADKYATLDRIECVHVREVLE